MCIYNCTHIQHWSFLLLFLVFPNSSGTFMPLFLLRSVLICWHTRTLDYICANVVCVSK